MRLKSFEILSTGPIKRVSVGELADLVVLAGPNGVGKTNVNNAILQMARQPTAAPNKWMIVEATSDEERQRWGQSSLDTRVAADAIKLGQSLKRNQRRNRYQGSFLNFDSDRAVRNVQSYGFSWDVGDPFSEDIGWDIGFSSLSNRYNDVRHSLFRLVESQRRDIAEQAIKQRAEGKSEMILDFPDVLKPFKDAFWQLLAPKKLLEVNVREQQIYYEYQGQRLSIETLSSGEKEVVNIVFDFILRGPSHCIVVFDEPELHLHPELSYKLLQTLTQIGAKNQFLFSSHSPEIISSSLENTVVFITPPQGEDQNQAIIVNRDDKTHHALQALGQSIGVISLGKKIILVEGEEASLDKQTYGAILRNRFPEFVLVPVGGRGTLRSFDDIRDSILNRTIWGVQFYLLCDRDAVNLRGPGAIASQPKGRIQILPRYHLENYFLEAEVLARVFSSMEAEGSWLRDEVAVGDKLKELARSVVPYAVALNVNASIREKVGNVSIMPKNLDAVQSADALVELMSDRVRREAARVSAGLDVSLIAAEVDKEFARLTAAIDAEGSPWKRDLPGRVVLHKFASAANIQPGRLKQLYLSVADQSQTFRDVVDIFDGFRASAATPA